MPTPTTASPEPGALSPSPLARQFCAYACAAMPPQPALPCNRRDFYKLALFMTGQSCLHQGEQSWAIQGPALTFCSVAASYTWESFEESAGQFCEFAPEFVISSERGGSLHNLPLFTSSTSPVLPLTAAQAHAFTGIFSSCATAWPRPTRSSTKYSATSCTCCCMRPSRCCR